MTGVRRTLESITNMPSSEVFKKFGAGKLKSSSGQPVTNDKQAVAIFESEKRKEAANGGVYPERKKRKSKFFGN